MSKDNKDSVQNAPPPAPPKKSDAELAAEAAELQKLLDEETAARAAAAAMAAAAASPPAVSAVAAPPKKKAGDISVLVLKSEPIVRLGGRNYTFVKGAEIDMNPDHAEEMEVTGWVLRRK